MPATVTHAYFTNDIYDILPENIKNRLNLKRLKMFGQAYDPFMFYNLFSILPGKKVRNLSEYFHSNKTRAFFINNLNIIKENNLSNDKDTLSFLTGFICHYALDSTLHPYIIYKTGVMDKKYKNTYNKKNNYFLFFCKFFLRLFHFFSFAIKVFAVTPESIPSLPVSLLIISDCASITMLIMNIPLSLYGIPILPTIYSPKSESKAFISALDCLFSAIILIIATRLSLIKKSPFKKRERQNTRSDISAEYSVLHSQTLFELR